MKNSYFPFGPSNSQRRFFNSIVPVLLLGAACSADALTINPIWDASVTNSGVAASIKSGFADAAQFFQNTYSDPITINIDVFWGASGPFGSDPGNGGGSSIGNYMVGYSYNTIRTALTNDVKSSADVTSFTSGTVPNANPGTLSSYMLPTAEAKALNVAFSYGNSYDTNFGLQTYGATNNVDGWVSFGANTNWFFSQSSVVSNKYDFVGTAEHEISEVLGRITFIAKTNVLPYELPFDLFRYTAAGSRTFDPTSAGPYFSFDNGTNNLGNFNAIAGNGDLADLSSPTNDPYYYLSATGLNVLSGGDITMLDVIGYDVPEPSTVALLTIPAAVALVRYRRAS